LKKQQKNWYSKVKNRLHLDEKCNKAKAEKVVQPANVSEHKFFPFIHFQIKQFKLSKKLEQRENELSVMDPYKKRDIYYAGHLDSYIYSYYNEKLLEYYERFLQNNYLECSIAYRHIDKNNVGTGKSNIDFAAEAFKEIKNRKECYAIGLDIHSFFDELDHKILYKNLCKLTEKDKLPDDLYQIYKILTKFHFIELDELLNNKYIKANRSDFWDKETHSFKKICSTKIFRTILTENKDIIKKNPNVNKGIPQGTNLSGTLANIYMLDFDVAIQNFVSKINGYYRRYSDDILILVNTKKELDYLLILVENELNKLKLELSKHKTVCCHFNNDNCEFEPCSLRSNYSGNAEFQYLGFTYNGKIILVRNGTIGAFWRDAIRHIRKMVLYNYKNKTRIPIAKIYGLYSHLSNRESKYGNFYSYIRKSQRIFEKDYQFGKEVKIKSQMSKSWEILHKYLTKLKEKYKISDKELPIPKDIRENSCL
jgi:hypothetical protein